MILLTKNMIYRFKKIKEKDLYFLFIVNLSFTNVMYTFEIIEVKVKKKKSSLRYVINFDSPLDMTVICCGGKKL